MDNIPKDNQIGPEEGKVISLPEGIEMSDFIGHQAEGALANHTDVVKVNSEKEDRNPNGTKGLIVGSIGTDHPVNIAGKMVKYLYFVIWDTDFDHPVATIDFKIQEA